MGMKEITQTKGWKNFMAKVYGWGACVVLIGALFKIQHFPGAGPMLTVGLLVEALIFFFSAFEPVHEEDDWSLVFPQLAGLEPDEKFSQATTTTTGGGSQLDKLLLESVDNPEEVFEKLGKGLANLSNTASSLSEISNATLATKEYTNNMKSAAKSAEGLSSSFQKSSETINSTTSSYQNLSESMNIDFSGITDSNKTYSEQVQGLNKNLSALNAVFELQLKNSNNSLKNQEELYGGLDEMMSGLKDSVKESQKYRVQVSQLGEKLEALNTVYGNMLSAMNVK